MDKEEESTSLYWGGVVLVRNPGFAGLEEAVKEAARDNEADLYALVMDMRGDALQGFETRLDIWGKLAGMGALPMAVVVRPDDYAGMVKLSTRLALDGGLLGVFTELSVGITWAQRQALVFAPEAGQRIQALVGKVRKPVLERLGLQCDQKPRLVLALESSDQQVPFLGRSQDQEAAKVPR